MIVRHGGGRRRIALDLHQCSARRGDDCSDRGDAVVALDAVDAGIGDKVLLATEGFSAMTSVGRPNSPIDMAVIGFIDHIELVQGVN